MNKLASAVLVFGLWGCGPGGFDDSIGDGLIDTETELPCDGTEGIESCPTLDPDWPFDDSVACRAIDCAMDKDERMICTAALYIEDGHQGDFSMNALGPISGDVDWNAWPYNADAGDWEDADYVGEGLVCGFISINTAEITPGVDGKRYVDLSCTDWTSGQFTTHRVWLTPSGPVPD